MAVQNRPHSLAGRIQSMSWRLTLFLTAPVIVSLVLMLVFAGRYAGSMERVGEAAALKPEHTNLARCRAGEYEALYEKMTNPDKQPDCMPAVTIADGQVVESIQRTEPP